MTRKEFIAINKVCVNNATEQLKDKAYVLRCKIYVRTVDKESFVLSTVKRHNGQIIEEQSGILYSECLLLRLETDDAVVAVPYARISILFAQFECAENGKNNKRK